MFPKHKILKIRPTSKIDRILHEFPWLWRLRSNWSEFVHVSFHEVTEAMLESPFSALGDVSVSVKGEMGTEQRVYGIRINRSIPLAHMLIHNAPTGFIITNYAVERVDGVGVFRAPRGENFSSMLWRACEKTRLRDPANFVMSGF